MASSIGAECASCKKRIANKTGSVSFLCPSCGRGKIVRCTDCRKNAAKYTCPECGFIGPN